MNPYKVLGVSENATQEEIRKAYLTLVKKYHPDRYQDGPLKDQANEKLKEINQAYEMLTKKSDSGSSRGYGSYNSYNSYSSWQDRGSYSGEGAADFARVRSYLSQNNLDAAASVLDTIMTRNAEWYYLYGIVYWRRGWSVQARQYLSQACRLDPSNMEYQNAYNAVNASGQSYGSPYGTPNAQNCDTCSLCEMLWCLNCLCNLGGCH